MEHPDEYFYVFIYNQSRGDPINAIRMTLSRPGKGVASSGDATP